MEKLVTDHTADLVGHGARHDYRNEREVRFRPDPNVHSWRMSLKKSPTRQAMRSVRFGRKRFPVSGSHRLRAVRQELGQLPDVLCGGCQVELVAGPKRTSEP